MLERFSEFLGAVIKALGAVLVGMIVLAFAVLTFFSWSNSNTEVASYQCVLRRMEHQIEDDATSVYHDTCMAASGYRRVGSCNVGSYVAAPPICFAPRWHFWN